MPSLDIIVEAKKVQILPKDGNLLLDPALPGLNRVLLRQLYCWLRVPQISGARLAVLDIGAPLSILPHYLWSGIFRWQAGRDYDELSIAGIGTTLRGQVLHYRYSCRLARLREPVELAGANLRGPRLRIDNLVCQLADPGGPPLIILGLWGGVFEGRKLAFDRQPNSDELNAKLEW